VEAVGDGYSRVVVDPKGNAIYIKPRETIFHKSCGSTFTSAGCS